MVRAEAVATSSLEAKAMETPEGAPSSIRLIVLLAVVALVGYALRSNIAVAQEFMAPELGLTMGDMGLVSAWGFQFAYALFQIPGGFLGDRYGARIVLGISILGWSLASLISGMVTTSAGMAFATLFATRALLGVTQAPTYPVASMAVAQYVPENQRVRANSSYIAASTLGSALAPLTLAPLMVRTGWREVFFASALVGLVTALAWFAYAPREKVFSASAPVPPIGQQFKDALHLLRHRPLLWLSASYLLHSAVYFVFVFWLFRYLTEARGFGVLASGMWASVPNFMAFLAAPLIGIGADRLSRRVMPATARRWAAMACLMTAAAFVLIGANLPSAYLAIVALGVSVGCITGAEAPFWTTATTIGAKHAGAAGGVLNLMGNLGGVLSIWLVPLMKDAWGWTWMLAFWAGIAVVAALLWLAVRIDGA
jgi:ACS family glucarate transporter-like MFS transporter